LKVASAEVQEQVPALQQEIEEHQQTIVDREASIKRLLNELEETKADLSTQRIENDRMNEEAEGNARDLAAADERAKSLQSDIDQRDEQIGHLNDALSDFRQTVEALEARVATADRQADELEQSASELRDAIRLTEELRGTVDDRNVDLAKRTAEMEQLASKVAEVQSQSAAAAQAAERGCAEADAKTAEKQSQVNQLKLEVEDLNSLVSQQERWLGKLKDTLSERESIGNDLRQEVESLKTELVSTNAELDYQREAQQLLETEKRAREREAADYEAEAKRAIEARDAAELTLVKAELAASRSIGEPAVASKHSQDSTESDEPNQAKRQAGASRPSATDQRATEPYHRDTARNASIANGSSRRIPSTKTQRRQFGQRGTAQRAAERRALQRKTSRAMTTNPKQRATERQRTRRTPLRAASRIGARWGTLQSLQRVRPPRTGPLLVEG
jgi:epidermal growth factor receptor substrate 15